MSKAGKLIHKIEIQKNLSTAVNDANEPINKWITIRKCWAGIEPVGSREFFSAVQLNFETTHDALIRDDTPCTDSRNSITQGCRVIWGDRVLSIEGVMRVADDSRYLRLSCTEDTRPAGA